MTRLRSRAGATMVMVAILMSVLLGMAALSIDVSRMLLIREELQSSSDAAALAAAVELSHHRLDNVVATALAYGRSNHVETTQPDLDAADVEVGTWDYDSRTFEAVPRAQWSSTPVNAVRVTARYSASYTFARVFNQTPGTILTRSSAAVGHVLASSCVKPWAMRYQELLDGLSSPGSRSAASYELNPMDVATLASVDAVNGNTARFTPDSVGQLRLPASGGYGERVTQCSDAVIRPGEVVDVDPSVQANDIGSALRDYCDAHGGTNAGGYGAGSFSCPGRPRVKIVLWDAAQTATPGGNPGGGGGGGTKPEPVVVGYRVRYIGALAITGFSATRPHVRGYFTTAASGGAFSTTPSPLTRVVLVK